MAVKRPFAGELTTLITIKQRVLQKGEYMEDVETFTDVCTTRAAVNSDTGVLVSEEKVHHIVKNVFTIRTRPGVFNVSDLEVHLQDGQKFKVIHVAKLQRSHLVMNCGSYE